MLMQKALLAASRTSLFFRFRGKYGDAAAVSVKLQSNVRAGSRVAWKGNMVTRAGQQVEQAAGEDPKVEIDSEEEDEIASGSHPHTQGL